MAMHNKPIFFKLLLISVLITCSSQLHAQLTASNNKKLDLPDSSRYIITASATNNQTVFTSTDDQKILENIDVRIKKPQERRKLMAYLKKLNGNTDPQYNKQAGPKFYYHLANTFARLRLYPLAMKYYFKSMAYTNTRKGKNAIATIDTSQNRDIPEIDPDSSKRIADYMGLNSGDDSLLTRQSAQLENIAAEQKSKPITYQRIITTFNDSKKAVAYAILVHVKQPSPGKRKIFVLTNTGHTFITLIKYNADSTYVSLSFGFYPNKDNILSATPLEPTTSSVFKDDSGHQWDEVLGKFISKRRFERILALAQKYHEMKYNLSKNNCTDFGINAAILAGINISETSGKWPLGSGNNPAITGQSILNGKFYDTDKSGQLFIASDSLTVKR